MTPTTAVEEKTVPIQKTVFDLDTFEEVTLYKPWTFAGVASLAEAQAKLGNDSARLLAVINDGLRSEVREKFRNDPAGWHVLDDEGEINGEFDGTVADPKAVNAVILNMAKHVFGYSKDLSKEQKKVAKSQAMELVKNSETIRKGLQKNAAA